MPEIKERVLLHLTSLKHGGAGMFTIDFHHNMLAVGCESYVAIRGKEMLYPDGSVHTIEKTRPYIWNKIKRFLFRKIIKHLHIDSSYSMFNTCERFTCYSAADTLAAMPVKPDVVFVHWVSDYANAKFLNEMKELTGAEIFYIMVDHALYSGGCHYQIECQRYKDGCHNCPANSSWFFRRAIMQNFAFKKRFLPYGTILVNSDDEALRFSQSVIYKDFKFKRFMFPIDSNKFIPIKDKTLLRSVWSIPPYIKVVFFGSTNLNERRKGMRVLLDALNMIKTKNVAFVAAGKTDGLILSENTKAVGVINESQLIQMYQMSDVFVCPSLADAGPMMVKQAMMCGTPVVAFPVGVAVDLVKTDETGYLSKYGDPADMAKGIDHILSLSAKKWNKMSDNCRRLALHIYAGHLTNKYKDLFY